MGTGTVSRAIVIVAAAAACVFACGSEKDGGTDAGEGADGGTGGSCAADSVKCTIAGGQHCFAAGTDCSTLLKCGSMYWGCKTGSYATCATTDVAICCQTGTQLYCKIDDKFLGCVAATSDCSTGVDCGGDHWAFCPPGYRPNCSTKKCDPG